VFFYKIEYPFSQVLSIPIREVKARDSLFQRRKPGPLDQVRFGRLCPETLGGILEYRNAGIMGLGEWALSGNGWQPYS
jgi:hypothetical protein